MKCQVHKRNVKESFTQDSGDVFYEFLCGCVFVVRATTEPVEEKEYIPEENERLLDTHPGPEQGKEEKIQCNYCNKEFDSKVLYERHRAECPTGVTEEPQQSKEGE